MGDGVTRINVEQAQSVRMTTGSFAAGTTQAVPPYPGPPIGSFFNPQSGTLQAAPTCPPYSYNQQFGAVQAAPVGGYFNPSPVPVVTNNTYTQQVTQVKLPDTNVVVVEPPERDCYYYCFDCSAAFEWYDLRGKGLCWIFLLLLLWLTVGAVIAFFIALWCALVCLSSCDD